MNERGIRNTLSQLNFCYGTNRCAENPIQLYAVNMRDQTKMVILCMFLCQFFDSF